MFGFFEKKLKIDIQIFCPKCEEEGIISQAEKLSEKQLAERCSCGFYANLNHFLKMITEDVLLSQDDETLKKKMNCYMFLDFFWLLFCD